jgi:hypothetical protein
VVAKGFDGGFRHASWDRTVFPAALFLMNEAAGDVEASDG